jgi:hypothetical protein
VAGFSQTFTDVTGSLYPIFYTPDGTTPANFAIVDFEMFAGTSDLNTNWATKLPLSIQNADLMVGSHQWDTGSTVNNGAFQHGSHGVLQFLSTLNLSAYTLIYIARKATTTVYNPSFEPVISKLVYGSWRDFTVGQFVNGGPGSNIGNTILDAPFSVHRPTSLMRSLDLFSKDHS